MGCCHYVSRRRKRQTPVSLFRRILQNAPGLNTKRPCRAGLHSGFRDPPSRRRKDRRPANAGASERRCQAGRGHRRPHRRILVQHTFLAARPAFLAMFVMSSTVTTGFWPMEVSFLGSASVSHVTMRRTMPDQPACAHGRSNRETVVHLTANVEKSAAGSHSTHMALRSRPVRSGLIG